MPKHICTDQNVTLRIIIEESLEYQSPLIVNVVDFQKAIDRLIDHFGNVWLSNKIYKYHHSLLLRLTLLYKNRIWKPRLVRGEYRG